MNLQILQPATRLQAIRFAREHRWKLLAISVVILVPCFWHREIVASDLGSHLYNAWLVQLIHHGQAPGLWIANQWTNVLFDFLLSGLGRCFRLATAEKIAVSVSVLIFFWGFFALVAAATRRAPWLLTPCIALFTYGWTFHMGFFNFYLSLGLSFIGLAIFWRGEGREKLWAVLPALLALVAHPLGVAWLAGAAAYVAIAEHAPRIRYQLLLFCCAAVAIAGLHWYLWRYDDVYASTPPFYFFNGADQLVLFGTRYKTPEFALLAFVVAALVVDLARRHHEQGLWRSYAIPLQLYVLMQLGIFLLPGGIHFPAPEAALALLTERLTTISAALACCLLGAVRPSKWHLAASAAIAIVFFTFVYQDTGIANRMETQVRQLVRTLPPDQRVMATIVPPPHSRILLQHMIDRACIGYCFSYGNYEPSTGLFRVRALPGNPYVLADYDRTIDMENGGYAVQPQDLPMYQVYQCSEDGTKLCITPLQAGENNDDMGVHPDDD